MSDDLDFLAGLDTGQARTYLEHFREQGEREALRQLHGTELNFSFDSIALVLDWLVQQMRYVAVPAPEQPPRGVFRRTPPELPPTIKFDEPTKLRMALGAWYFGETFVRRSERLGWGLGTGIYLNLPAVRGFAKGEELPPQWVVQNMLRRRVAEMHREDIPPITDAIESWRSMI